MLTSDQLDALVDPVMELYADYQDSVIRDIARRLAGMDYARPTAAWQMQRLSESGKVYEDILDELAKLTGKSESVLRAMFEKAGVKAMRFDDSIYRAAGLNPLPLNLSPAMAQVLAAGLRKTNGIVKNLTMTTAIDGQQAFLNAADLAYMQVTSGAMSYTEAIRDGVKKVAANGLSVIQFPGRRDQLDVALRRTVLTGINQTVGNLQIARADEMGVDLVQTSAHIGARNTGVGPANHEGWQGKIYSRSGNSKKYPGFVESTGYGTGPGLMGWNCRHSFYPFFEGISENAYSKAELESYASKTVKYNGEEISLYDATQKQRSIERKIRYWKRQAGSLEAAGFDTTQETAKVRAWQKEMRSFTKQTGLIRQGEREKVTGILTKSPSSVGNTRYSTKSEGSVPPGKYNYREALSIQNANGFAKKTLGIKFADYSGIDLETANNWNEWLSESMNRMPELKKTITGTGTSQARYRAEYKIFVEKLRKRNLPLEEAERLAKKMALKTPPKCHAYSITNASSGINGIFINKNFDAANIAADVRSGFHPVGTGTLKGIFDHEIAHHIDELLGLSKSLEINKLFASLKHFEIEVGLSRYAAKKGIEEFIAEAWSEYLNNPNPRLLARQVGDIINQKYVLLAGTK